jgi:hypothetical protein
MPELSPELEGTDLVVEIEGADENAAKELRACFNGDDEDVTVAHSFGGVDVLTILTTLSQATLGKLIDSWSKLKLSTTKTTFKIDKSSITMNGFSRSDIEALLASPDFQKAVRSAQKK